MLIIRLISDTDKVSDYNVDLGKKDRFMGHRSLDLHHEYIGVLLLLLRETDR